MTLGIEMKNIKIIKYDTSKFKFQELIYRHFKKKNKNIKKDLSNIHNKIFFSNNVLHQVTKIKKPIYKLKKNYFDVRKDQKNKFITYFYKIDPVFNLKNKNKKYGKFIIKYNDLIKEIQDSYFKEKIIYQKKPTLRVHIPDNISVGSYHVDSDYGHAKEAINFWLPFNNAKKTCTLWLESAPGKKDYKPYKVNYGEILIFNSNLAHGTEVNKEKYTRFSMDFRVIKKKRYKKRNSKSPKNKIKFILGEYYTQFK